MVRWALPSPYWVKVNVGVGYSISNQKAVSKMRKHYLEASQHVVLTSSPEEETLLHMQWWQRV
ncbi:hypothetical protein Goari_019894 [Gossypium aridum]|uniref:Uncharacterized protein n=1 Tax=Gossypium aridum TaxID=34290 RepID=A0A7J8WV55_GOSAI|nr:hypothetical protein [Gossypium aridum]